MVELPSGKMKSREGTVVDADDLIDEMIATAKSHTEKLGKVKEFTEEELNELYETLGIGAMKFYLLRVDPQKKMIFNPEDSIDFHGFTGPFVQYTFARIQSILRKVGNGQWAIGNEQLEKGNRQGAIGNWQWAIGNWQSDSGKRINEEQLLPAERSLILLLEQYSAAVEQASDELDPSVIANYVFHLAQKFNSFYAEHSVTNAETDEKKQLRLRLSVMCANIIKSSMRLLGIEVPDKM
jgi:arginyl-tRNA synthetase